MMQVKESKSQERLVCVVLDFLDHVPQMIFFTKESLQLQWVCFAQQHN